MSNRHKKIFDFNPLMPSGLREGKENVVVWNTWLGSPVSWNSSAIWMSNRQDVVRHCFLEKKET
jgi:hypothetical protein